MASVRMSQAEAPVSKKGFHRTLSTLGGAPGCRELGLQSGSVMSWVPAV